jgi:hypothetical protein
VLTSDDANGDDANGGDDSAAGNSRKIHSRLAHNSAAHSSHSGGRSKARTNSLRHLPRVRQRPGRTPHPVRCLFLSPQRAP